MAITVSWPDDPINFPNFSAKDGQGRTMTRTALVQGTDDHAIALTATGIPFIGGQWGSSSGLYCRAAKAMRWGGADHAGNNTGGACKVTCEFSTIGVSNWGPMPLGPESNYTEINYTRKSVQVTWGWIPGGPYNLAPGDRGPINNGEGIAKEVAQFSLKVHAYTLNPAAINMVRLLNLGANGSRNAAALSFPKFKTPVGFPQTPPSLDFGIGQVRYMGPESTQWIASQTGNGYVYEIVHLFEVAPDWTARWTETDKDGVPKRFGNLPGNPPQIASADIYDLADMGGLW